jgi:hypothetical protein
LIEELRTDGDRYPHWENLVSPRLAYQYAMYERQRIWRPCQWNPHRRSATQLAGRPRINTRTGEGVCMRADPGVKSFEDLVLRKGAEEHGDQDGAAKVLKNIGQRMVQAIQAMYANDTG